MDGVAVVPAAGEGLLMEGSVQGSTSHEISVGAIERAAKVLYSEEFFRKQTVWATPWVDTSDAIRADCRWLAEQMLKAAMAGSDV